MKKIDKPNDNKSINSIFQSEAHLIEDCPALEKGKKKIKKKKDGNKTEAKKEDASGDSIVTNTAPCTDKKSDTTDKDNTSCFSQLF